MNYYNGAKLLNKNKPFNFCIGNRSAGKSFYWKRHCIKNFIEKGEMFVYVRRYKSDLDAVIDTIFEDVKFKFPNHEFKIVKDQLLIDDELAGYAIPVSSFTKYKSVMFDKVTTIMFDEFIPENGRYIGGKDKPLLEPEMCFNFYQTVARGFKKVIREDVKFIFIANAVTVANPYFFFFKIDKLLKSNTKFLTRDGFAVEIAMMEDVRSQVLNTEFGRMIQGTDYGNYSLDNKFYLDSNEFIDHPKGKGIYLFNLLYDGVLYAVYRYTNEGLYYITDKADKDFPSTYVLTLKDHSVNYVALNAMSHKIKPLRQAYSYGMVRFNSLRAKNMFLMMLA